MSLLLLLLLWMMLLFLVFSRGEVPPMTNQASCEGLLLLLLLWKMWRVLRRGSRYGYASCERGGGDGACTWGTWS